MSHPLPGLRDIHLPASPAWWPPAPGWWLLAGVLALALIFAARYARRALSGRHRVRAALSEFDAAMAAADGAPARLAAASSLLRRAARTRDPAAAVLEGDAWLRFLDGDDPARSFSTADGALLRDGAFRRNFDADIAPAIALARARFAALLESKIEEHGHV